MNVSPEMLAEIHKLMEEAANKSADRCTELMLKYIPVTLNSSVRDAIMEAYGLGIMDGGESAVKALMRVIELAKGSNKEQSAQKPAEGLH